ncbi:MAG: pentapeptide repeat-containing protein [Pseudomonadota bacterium]
MTDDDHLKRINALTSNARQTWFALLAALVFVGITLMGVEHIDFYGVDRATTLPLVNVEVPTRLFFIAAPILIAAIYGYFHLYLIRLFDALGAAPIRVNKMRLGDAVAPWLVTDAAMDFRSEHRGDNSTRPRVLDRSSRYLNFLLVWVFGLILLGLLWWQAQAARDLVISFTATLSFMVSAFTGYESWRVRSVRLGQQDQSISPKRVLQRQPIGVIITIWFALLSVCGGVAYVVTEHRHLVRIDLSGENIVDRPAGWLPYSIAREEFFAIWCKRTDAPCSFPDLNLKQYNDFNEEWWTRRGSTIDDLRQPNWSSKDGDLTAMDFRKAALYKSYLVDANLSNALLQGAELTIAKLERADLILADLSGATLVDTHLETADLRSAKMSNVSLSGAQMQHAILNASEISGTKNKNVLLRDTDLRGSVNKGGMLRDVDLKEAMFDETTDFRNVFLDGSVMMTDEFRELMSSGDSTEPCQWVMDRTLPDEEFYRRWLGWLEKGVSTRRDRLYVPLRLVGLDPIPPPEGCEWKTGPMSGAVAK